MEGTDRRDSVYQDCKTLGLQAVAGRLGVEPGQLVEALYCSGVAREDGCPSQREIAQRCRDVQRSRTSGTAECPE